MDRNRYNYREVGEAPFPGMHWFGTRFQTKSRCKWCLVVDVHPEKKEQIKFEGTFLTNNSSCGFTSTTFLTTSYYVCSHDHRVMSHDRGIDYWLVAIDCPMGSVDDTSNSNHDFLPTECLGFIVYIFYLPFTSVILKPSPRVIWQSQAPEHLEEFRIHKDTLQETITYPFPKHF